jgi:hypothetical protein
MREGKPQEQNAFFEWAITARDAEHRIARAIRICVGNHLRQTFDDILKANSTEVCETVASFRPLDQQFRTALCF